MEAINYTFFKKVYQNKTKIKNNLTSKRYTKIKQKSKKYLFKVYQNVKTKSKNIPFQKGIPKQNKNVPPFFYTKN